MRGDGIETLRAVVRRSRLLLIVLVLIGIVSMNLIRNSQGPQYAATARVILAPTDLAATVAGFDGYVDPRLVDETEQALASSRQLFEAAARTTNGRVSASSLAAKVGVAKVDSTVRFTATSDDADDAVTSATLVARAYPEWRASVSNEAITEGIKEVEAQLETQANPDPDLAAQLSRLKILQTLNSGNVLLTEPARSAAKTRPNPVRDSLLGAFIGLFVALVAVALREAVDTRIRSESEIEDILDIPVLGTVERLPRNTGLVGFGRNRERYADVYDLLVANLVQSRPRAVIAVTSATPAEGKTTTAANLAAALARRADKVALVDLDRRRPTVAKVFRIPSEARGVESILRGGAPLESVTWSVPLDGATAMPRPILGSPFHVNGNESRHATLRVLPFRATGTTANDRFDAAALEQLLTNVRKRFDYVVIDTAPALSVPDVTELATLVDVVIVVVRHGRVTSSSLSAFGRLRRSWPQTDTTAILVGAPRHADNYTYYTAS
jgi:Mrp family chromosome partitioning ATPase